ncbi:MAG: cytochrome c-type biogenesis protein CcmH [Candidatus Rokubacteria bacterium]|nr:cytochrome c-type biogenesis protein CcmH [Candidatus Rokubacteria bacterium]
MQPGCRRAWRLVLAVLALVAAVAAVALVTPVAAQPPATNVDDARLYDIGSQLRCVVCQNLSVGDSPSEMAQQMRGVIRERLAAGDTPEQVVQYFVDKYGEWILLKPRKSGFNWLVWLAPYVAVAVGLALFAIVLRRWTRTRRTRAATVPGAVDPAMRERIRRELELEGDR